MLIDTVLLIARLALAGVFILAGAIPSGDVVLTLATLELNDREQMRFGKGSDGVDEAIVYRANGGR